MVASLLIVGLLNLISIWLFTETGIFGYLFLTGILTILSTFIALSIRVVNQPKSDLVNQLNDARLRASDVRNEVSRLTSIIKYHDDIQKKYEELNSILNPEKTPSKTDTYNLKNDEKK